MFLFHLHFLSSLGCGRLSFATAQERKWKQKPILPSLESLGIEKSKEAVGDFSIPHIAYLSFMGLSHRASLEVKPMEICQEKVKDKRKPTTNFYLLWAFVFHFSVCTFFPSLPHLFPFFLNFLGSCLSLPKKLRKERDKGEVEKGESRNRVFIFHN